MSIKALQEYTRYAKYALPIPDKNRRETWGEMINRLDEMHRTKLGDKLELIKDDYEFAIDMLRQKRVLGSQRALQFGGQAILNKEDRLYNCSASYCDRARFFQEVMYVLLCGCGAGFSVQKHHIAKLPKIALRDNSKSYLYVVPDTIEGWSDSIGVLLSSYFVDGGEFPDYKGIKVEFNYDLIRPAGAPLSWGGKAPGPDGLIRAHILIEQVLEKCVSKGDTLRPIDAYDIIMHESDAVLSGGVRRCLPKGSKVHTKYGMKNIEEIEIGEEVLTSKGYQKVSNKFEQGLQKLVRIKTQDGFLECTGNHKIAVLTGQDVYIWKMAQDLELGDRMIAPSQAIEGEKVSLPSFDYIYPAKSTMCRKITIPELDEEIAWFLGLVQGDGHVHLRERRGYVSVAINNEQAIIEERVKKILMRFGVTITHIDRQENYCVVRSESKQLATYFHSWLKQSKTCLSVPDFMWRASTSLKLAYVAGLMDADGSCVVKPVQVAVSVYEEFLHEIQLLLSSCGIQTRLKGEEKDFRIRKANWQTIKQLVIINNKTKKAFQEIPLLTKKEIVIANEKNTNSYSQEIYGKCYPGNFPWSNTENKLIPVSVVEVTETNIEKETWDLEIENVHEFFCNGYLVHNSATLCMFSVDDKEMIEAKTGNWFETNPQRGRSNNSAVLVRSKTSKEQFDSLMSSVKQFGEPGFIWCEDEETLYNPCFERNTRITTEKGIFKITDLMKSENNVLIDTRVGKGDLLEEKRLGVKLSKASPVVKTGENVDIYRITTQHGYTVEATAYHLFPTFKGRKQLKDLIVNDLLCLQSQEGTWGTQGDYDDGLMLGLVVGDGCFCKNMAMIDVWESDFDSCEDILRRVTSKIETVECKKNRKYPFSWSDKIIVPNQKDIPGVPAKRIALQRLYTYFQETLHIVNPEKIKNEVPECVWQGSREMVKGYLHGLIFCDGTVVLTGKGTASTLEIQIMQSSELLIKQIQQLLLNFGIVSRTRLYQGAHQALMPDGHGGHKLYDCKSQFRLEINRPNAIKLFDTIGLYGRKHEKLKALIEQRGRSCYKPERYITKITKIEFMKKDDVFCLTQPETNTVIANGIVSGQCVEIGLRGYDENGNSGWEYCNLVELNLKKCQTKEEFLKACKAAAIIGTVQAYYTNFTYLGPVTESIVRKEALLGVSMTGMMDSPEIAFDPELQKQGALLILDINEKVAKALGINPCARGTCVKPAGSTSCVLGTASGIHPHHAKRYFRRVQANKLETPAQLFKQVNPLAVEESVWSNNRTDWVLTFLCEVPNGAKTKNQMDAIALLEHVKLTQQNWVEYGTRHTTNVKPWLRHNVSNTISVRDEAEWIQIAEYIYANKQWFAGISLLPASGDKDYPQAPFVAVYTPTEIVREYGDGALMASGLIVDGLYAFDDNLWAACSCALGVGENLVQSEREIEKEISNRLLHAKREVLQRKKDWIRRAQQFADRYCEGNLRRLTYLLKDVHNWKLWCDLKREYKEIDWSTVVEKQMQVSIDSGKAGEACAGGLCELGEIGTAILAKNREKDIQKAG